MNMYYLDEYKNVLPCKSVEEWAKHYEEGDRIIKQEYVGNAYVSTVFLGLDHRYGFKDEPDLPVVFETMVFMENWNGEYQERCCTYEQALEMHEVAKEWAKSKVTLWSRFLQWVYNRFY